MISRDEIKEGMVVNTPGFEATPGDPLTTRTFDIFFDTLALLLEAGVTVVGEAAFQDHVWRKGLERLNADLRIIECRTDPANMTTRRADRYKSNAVHARAHVYPDPRKEWVGLSMAKLTVDTTDGYQPNLDDICKYALGAG